MPELLHDDSRILRWQPLQVISLAAAAARYGLADAELERVAQLLAGKERRLVRGDVGYFVADIEAVLGRRRAA